LAGNTRSSVATIRVLRLPAIAWARQSGVKLAANHLFDQPTNPVTDPGLDRVKLIVEKMGVTFGRRMRKLRLRGTACHGVVQHNLDDVGSCLLQGASTAAIFTSA
jgi:hypothetical protein